MFGFGLRFRKQGSLAGRGEAAAARHLRRQGCRILARNLRTPYAEVDVLAREGHILVLLEVKTTARSGYRPRVRHAQVQRLARAARWLAGRPALRTSTGAPCAFRLDHAIVTLDAGRFVVTIRRDVLPQR